MAGRGGGTDHDSTIHDTSYGGHDRSGFTYPSSYTEYGVRGQPANPSYVDPASHSYVSVPGVKIVEVEPGVQMFESRPRANLVLSIIFTFICCFACSIPALILSKQAVDLEREGEKSRAARLANQIAFWLTLSAVAGILCWGGTLMLAYAYRFY